MLYNYFIPQIHLGPPSDYTFVQELPLEEIKNLIIGDSAKFEISRTIISDKNILYSNKQNIKFNLNKWNNEDVSYFKWKPKGKYKNLCYIETQVNLIEGKGLISASLPGYYVHYMNSYKKNFLSCGNEKYGNPRVIMQMKEFGRWIDGYPAININKSNNTTYSIIIINPYEVKSTFDIEINNLKIKKSFSVSALSVKKINFFDIIKKNKWTGQFYISGKRRAIIYLINHAFDDFNSISTLEHSDPFRAEFTYKPRFQHLRSVIHKKIKRIFI